MRQLTHVVSGTTDKRHYSASFVVTSQAELDAVLLEYDRYRNNVLLRNWKRAIPEMSRDQLLRAMGLQR